MVNMLWAGQCIIADGTEWLEIAFLFPTERPSAERLMGEEKRESLASHCSGGS